MSALVPYAPPLSPDAAEQRALAIRAEIERRPDDAVIRAWLEYVAVAVARPRPTDDEIVTLTGVLLDGEYPAAVFNATTRREAARRFKYWPSSAEVFELLAPHIEAMGVELPGLDRIVRNAKRRPVVPALEAVGYDPGPAAPEVKPRRRPLRERGDDHYLDADYVEEQDAAGRAAAQAQLARLVAMGVDITPKPATPSLVRQDNPPSKPKRRRRLEVVR